MSEISDENAFDPIIFLMITDYHEKKCKLNAFGIRLDWIVWHVIVVIVCSSSLPFPSYFYRLDITYKVCAVCNTRNTILYCVQCPFIVILHRSDRSVVAFSQSVCITCQWNAVQNGPNRCRSHETRVFCWMHDVAVVALSTVSYRSPSTFSLNETCERTSTVAVTVATVCFAKYSWLIFI